MTAEPTSTHSGELPRHEDIVDERLVRWFFTAALTFLGISMLGGLLMAAQLIHWNPLERNRAALRGPLADGSHERRGLWIPGELPSWACCIGRSRD